ncbi:MAG: hypothetical protein S0880_11385, partial [Actinomycetota bacterium]|nr:hypothetical protein [Actinomycetota bacterium]
IDATDPDEGAPSHRNEATTKARPYVLPFTGLLAGGVAAEVVVAVRSSARVTGHPRARATAFVPAWPLRALDASTTVALGVAVAVVRLGAPAGVALASAGAAVVAWAVAQFGLAVVTAEPRRDSAVASDRVDAALRALGAQHIVGAAVAVSVLANQQLVLLLEGSSWWSDLALYGVIACGCSVWPHLARGRRWPMAGLADAAPRPDHPGPDGPDRRALPEQV